VQIRTPTWRPLIHNSAGLLNRDDGAVAHTAGIGGRPLFAPVSQLHLAKPNLVDNRSG
ncbi:MAG TPA: hypothetical protein GXZ82_03925, partial [Firmicutes bacterium]|nr:hypothetical protein [Bacillota bacterium]